MSFQVSKMFDMVNSYIAKSRNTNISETEIKNQVFQAAMQEARAVRCHSGQIRYMLIVDLLKQFVQGLYYSVNFPVPQTDFFCHSLRVDDGVEIAERFQELLDILGTSQNYNPFSHQYIYLLGMAKASCIEKTGESLLYVVSLFKHYYEAYGQVMEIYCDCKQ